MTARADFPILPLLRASGPYPPLRDELMLFGQFVGVWNMQVEFFNDHGDCVYSQPGQWSFAWVLDGACRARNQPPVLGGPSIPATRRESVCWLVRTPHCLGRGL
jgi:hypothetical protein